ncbi:unnamed protein product [Adineta ricciae]|uniref:Phosphatidylinositol-specific phospholipase C X domain-containing protein n=1 Tax=Adineta ricciae TaxID=249248 RepID=A0A814J0M3_ADIRI|nr:unnamed protein product [Adineta ricciae]CAF1162954.1 unnamed protein product [Adineta ricciae]
MNCCGSVGETTMDATYVEWMKNLPIELHNEAITKLAIPGTHDSFAFYLSRHAGPDMDANLRRLHVLISPIIKNWSITQNLTFAEQLQIGIRYFDLRVCRTTNESQSKRSPFTFTHGLLGGLVRDGLEEINAFLNQHSKEVVLLDFNHFYDFTDQCGHEQLIELIDEIFGAKICTTAETILECTLNYLWDKQQQVILLYERNRDQCSAYMNRIGHFFQICQSPWPNTPRADDLFRFLDEKISTTRSTLCVNVLQGQLTPDSATIQNNPFSSLQSQAREINRRLIEWLASRQRDPSLLDGVNVVICDFADRHFAEVVIKLNHKSLTSL